MESVTIFVFYNLGSRPCRWIYSDMPESARWVGGGSTTPIVNHAVVGRSRTEPQILPVYRREEQFSCAPDFLDETVSYLHEKFEHLRQSDAVLDFELEVCAD